MDNTPKLHVYYAPKTPEEYLAELLSCGGNLEAFCALHCGVDRLPGRFLFEVDQVVRTNKEVMRDWQSAIRRSLDIRFDFLQAKVMTDLENKSSFSTGDVAFSKMILDNILESRAVLSNKRASYPFAERLAKMRRAPGAALTGEEGDTGDGADDPIDDFLDEAS